MQNIIRILPLLWMGATASGENLLINGDFENADGAQPLGWTVREWAGTGRFAWLEDGRGGGKCLRIESSEGGDLSWKQSVPVEPGAVYRLSGWIRTEGVEPDSGRGALLNIHEVDAGVTEALTGDRGWSRVEQIFRTGDRTNLQVNALFGGWGRSRGRAWYDDLALEKLDVADLRPAVTVHTKETRESVHPFIYGQFIEHLGRCIYGGIWAEMLEDRKFFFPVTPAYDPYRASRGVPKEAPLPVVGASPWEIIGPPDSVEMVRENSFVGEHTPLVQPGSGIAQHHLGVLAGKTYEGYIWLKAEGGTATVHITLAGWAGTNGADRRSVTLQVKDEAYNRYPFRFTAGGRTDRASLLIQVEDRPCHVGTVSLMPGDNVKGFRSDTLALLKELNAPIYRWPGGNFVSGYDWRDGIGDRDRRSPRKNPAWTGVEHNDVGIDEFISFCGEIGAEPLIAVNTGFGDAYSAAQEVEYCNGGADTIGGSWRIGNGHPEPYGVKWWCIGNEMYGTWQLGYMRLEHYVLKHNEVAASMLRVDPSLKLIGVGSVGNWSEGMLEACADTMDLISEHFYVSRIRNDVVAHMDQIKSNIRRKAEAHRRYRERIPALRGKDIRIAMDEWNYWYPDYVYGELGCVYGLRDALGIAAGLHEYTRNSDIIAMANYAQTVNVIGCIKTTRTEAAFATTALPLMLYRREFGTLPVRVTGNASLTGIDVVAAWTGDRKALTLGVINPSAESRTLRVNIPDAVPGRQGKVWRIHGDDPAAYNEPGKVPRVDIREETVAFNGEVTVPGLSINLYRLPAPE